MTLSLGTIKSWWCCVQSKEGVRCFTDGCGGQLKLALELEVEAGIETHRRELLRLADQPKKPERPQQQQQEPELRRVRRRGPPAQKAPEPGGGPYSQFFCWHDGLLHGQRVSGDEWQIFVCTAPFVSMMRILVASLRH